MLLVYMLQEKLHVPGYMVQNRLASNSLLECLVFSQAAVNDMLNKAAVDIP